MYFKTFFLTKNPLILDCNLIALFTAKSKTSSSPNKYLFLHHSCIILAASISDKYLILLLLGILFLLILMLLFILLILYILTCPKFVLILVLIIFVTFLSSFVGPFESIILSVTFLKLFWIFLFLSGD